MCPSTSPSLRRDTSLRTQPPAPPAHSSAEKPTMPVLPALPRAPSLVSPAMFELELEPFRQSAGPQLEPFATLDRSCSDLHLNLAPGGQVADAKVQKLLQIFEPVTDFEHMLSAQLRRIRTGSGRSGNGSSPGQQDLTAAAAGTGRTVDPAQIATDLLSQGYLIQIRDGTQPAKDSRSCLRTLKHRFLVCLGWQAHPCDEPQYLEEPLVVEPRFREQFSIANVTSSYDDLLKIIPISFVGPLGRLEAIVELVANEVSAAFKELNRPLPPWRTQQAMMSKWAPNQIQELARLMARQKQLRDQGVQSGLLTGPVAVAPGYELSGGSAVCVVPLHARSDADVIISTGFGDAGAKVTSADRCNSTPNSTQGPALVPEGHNANWRPLSDAPSYIVFPQQAGGMPAVPAIPSAEFVNLFAGVKPVPGFGGTNMESSVSTAIAAAAAMASAQPQQGQHAQPPAGQLHHPQPIRVSPFACAAQASTAAQPSPQALVSSLAPPRATQLVLQEQQAKLVSPCSSRPGSGNNVALHPVLVSALGLSARASADAASRVASGAASHVATVGSPCGTTTSEAVVVSRPSSGCVSPTTSGSNVVAAIAAAAGAACKGTAPPSAFDAAAQPQEFDIVRIPGAPVPPHVRAADLEAAATLSITRRSSSDLSRAAMKLKSAKGLLAAAFGRTNKHTSAAAAATTTTTTAALPAVVLSADLPASTATMLSAARTSVGPDAAKPSAAPPAGTSTVSATSTRGPIVTRTHAEEPWGRFTTVRWGGGLGPSGVNKTATAGMV